MPTCLTVGDDAVWAAGDRSVARIDAVSSELLGVRDLGGYLIQCVAFGAGSLWIGASGRDAAWTRRRTRWSAPSTGERRRRDSRAIAVSDQTVCALVSSEVPSLRPSFLALLDVRRDG